MRKEQGITLIALVITIIVLLILAGVTINLTLGERGIFRTAQKAAQNYQNAGQEEMYGLDSLQNEINDTLAGLGQNNTTPNVQITNIEISSTVTSIKIGETAQLTATILPENATNKKVTWTSENTNIATVVQDGTVTGVAAGTTIITATAEDGSNVKGSYTITVTPTILSAIAEPGDYVEYDGGNGYTGKWQVLYNDSTYGLQIISSALVNESYTLSGLDGYNNAVNTLNTECRKYVNRLYATSGRCVGSNPLSPDDSAGTTNYWGYSMKNSDTNYTKDYEAMTKATKQNETGIHGIGKAFWLASRSVNSGSNIAYFYVNYVISSGGERCIGMCNVYSESVSGFTHAMGLRPVITLKSGIQTSSGDGSASAPFKLVAQ